MSKWQSNEPPRLVVSSPPSPTGSSRSGGTPKQSFSSTHSQVYLVETKWKGKRRATDDDEDEDITDTQNNNRIYDEHTEDEGSEYPPMGDDQLEERRVQETLKRWEEAERQRRKAARSSVRSPHSVVGDVSKRVSQLWSDTASPRPRPLRGSFKLKDSLHENDPSRNLQTSLAPSRSNSARTAISLPERRGSLSPSHSPLVLPEYPETSPFGNEERLANGSAIPPTSTSTSAIDRGAFMDPTSIPPTPMLEGTPPPTARPLLQGAEASTASSQRPTPSKVDPPKPNPGMQVRGPLDIGLLEEQEERQREQEDGRWWTDWMCGCKESGGQGHGQAGRTNPFE